MGTRKVQVKKAVAESVKAAAEAPTASVVKTDKPVRKPAAKKPAAKKPVRKYAEPKGAVEPKKVSEAAAPVAESFKKTGLTPGQQRAKTNVTSARVEANARSKRAAASDAQRRSTRANADKPKPKSAATIKTAMSSREVAALGPMQGPDLGRTSVKNQAAMIAEMQKNGTLKKFLQGKKK